MTNNSSTSIAKKQKCLLMRNDIEIWIDEDRAGEIENVLIDNPRAIVKFEGRLLNSVDIVGIFLPADLDDLKRRKQGQWKCKHGNWQAKEDSTCSCGQRHENWTGGRPFKKITYGENGKKVEY